MYASPIQIRHIYISSGHSYFGRPVGAPGPHPALDLQQVEVHAGAGLVGDRFYGVRPDFDGQVTFFSLEVFRQAVAALQRPHLSPALTRRNLIVEGMDLNGLIGVEFAIVQDGETLLFQGSAHCRPCRWMESALGPGGLAQLRGRGGLRSRILTGGSLRRGDATLHTLTPQDLTRIALPLRRPSLPDALRP